VAPADEENARCRQNTKKRNFDLPQYLGLLSVTFCEAIRTRRVEKPEDLRNLAEWYRSMAEVGHSDDCGWRQRFADYLERRAAEMETAYAVPAE
jgi:hypothetical protein